MPRLLTILALLPLFIAAILHFLYILYFAGTFCNSDASLTGKTVIVTGSNTGIGKTTAMDMAARGARVILACRSEARTIPAVNEIRSKTKNDQVIFMRLDLVSFQSVRDFAKEFIDKEERLDILINNAGLVSSNEPKFSEDGIEVTIAVNHLGPFLLTNLLLDVMKRSGPGGRIVNVASGLYNFANPAAFRDFDSLKTDGSSGYFESINLNHLENSVFSKMLYFIPDSIQQYILNSIKPWLIRYNNSKLANVLFTVELAKRLAGSGITAYSLHPGVITTDLGVDRNGVDAKLATKAVERLVQMVNPFLALRKTLEGGAQTTICCAVDEKLANVSGRYYSDCAEVEVRRPEFHDSAVVSGFWEWSAVMTKTDLSSGNNIGSGN